MTSALIETCYPAVAFCVAIYLSSISPRPISMRRAVNISIIAIAWPVTLPVRAVRLRRARRAVIRLAETVLLEETRGGRR